MSYLELIKHADNVEGLVYNTKSFKFELISFYQYKPNRQSVFDGRLIIPEEDREVFCEKNFIKTLQPRGHFPLLLNHDSHKPLGRLFLSFFSWPPFPDGYQKPSYDFRAKVILEDVVDKAKEIFDSIKLEKEAVIEQISLGHNLVGKQVIIIEGSILEEEK